MIDYIKQGATSRKLGAAQKKGSNDMDLDNVDQSMDMGQMGEAAWP